jgi:hypothetical protein
MSGVEHNCKPLKRTVEGREGWMGKMEKKPRERWKMAMDG